MENFPEEPPINEAMPESGAGQSPEVIENAATIENQKDLGSAALGATSVAPQDLDKQGIAGKPVETTTYIDSHGVVHRTAEECRAAEEGYR